MKSLHETLARYADITSAAFGEAGPPDGVMEKAPIQPQELNQLKSEMSAIIARDKVFFVIAFSLVVVIFVGLCIFVWSSLGDPAGMKKAMAAAGVSFFGPISWMLKLWKEKVASDLILALISNLRPEDIRPILEILLRKLK